MFRHRFRYLFILLLAIYSFFNILFTEGNKIFSQQPDHYTLFLTLLILVTLVWEGNRLINRFNETLGFSKPHPLITFFLLSVIYIIVISSLSTIAFNAIYPDHDLTLTLKLVIGFTFRVNLFLHSINAIIYFIERYRSAQLESEQLKKMHAEAKFEALRNQINPHFLFNSFNVLSTLVYKDPDTSSKFIDQLSDVYRYLLYNQENQVVTVKEELRFIEAYLYLLHIRFGNNLQVDLEIAPSIENKFIAPATLQMLIENAIKHNVVSKKHPLKMKIYNSGDYIVVENTILLKQVPPASSRLGLQNIRERYRFLSQSESISVRSDETFQVKIPLIDVQK